MASTTHKVPEQRGESRRPLSQEGTYLKSFLSGDTVTFLEGPVTVLNQSENGALLKVRDHFCRGDIIEVQWRDTSDKALINVFEVCWSDPLEEREQSRQYLIGVRLVFNSEWMKTSSPSTQTTTHKLAA
jgi:hypothetical protein